MIDIRQFVDSNNIIVAAHRGSSGDTPENTIAAFNAAVNSNVDMIEADIHFSADGIPFVFHDDSLVRTCGLNAQIEDLQAEQILLLDAGSWFSDEFKNEKIPTFNQLINITKDKVFLNLELKMSPNHYNEIFIKSLIDLIISNNIKNQILFASFNYDVINYIKKYCPEIPISIIKLPNDSALPSVLRNFIHFDAYICSIDELNQSIIDDTRLNNIHLALYDVDDKSQLDKAISANAIAIGTNYPDTILKLLNK